MMKKLMTILLVLLILPLSVLAGALTLGPSQSQTITKDPGQTASGSFTLGNSGSSDLLVDLSSRNVNFASASKNYNLLVSFNQNSVVVIPAGTPDATYSFTLPNDMFAGVYAGLLTISDNNSNSASHTISLSVNSKPSLSMTVPGATINSGFSGTSTATLANTGNTDLDVTLSVADLVNTADSSKKIDASNIVYTTSSHITYKEQGTKQLTINVPSTTQAGTYSGQVTASFNGQTILRTLTVTVQQPTYAFSLSPTELDFGSVYHNSSFSKTFTITNNGNMPLTGITISSNAASTYNIQFSQNTIPSLSVGALSTITVNGVISATHNSGNTNIGTITVDSAETASQALGMKANVIGKMTIDDLAVYVDGVKDSLSCGETISEDAKPGDEIIVEVRINNNFQNEADIDINDITITGTLVNIDDGDDLEDETDQFDVKADKTSAKQTLKFNVPMVVDEGKYELLLDIEGKDDNKVKQSLQCKVELDVNKESHDIIVDKLLLIPETLGCVRDGRLELKLINIGSRDEDNVRIEIRNSAVGLDIDERDIELVAEDAEDSVLERSYPITLSTNVKPSTYSIVAKIYRDTNILEDTESVPLKVEQCSSAPPTPPVEEPEKDEEEKEEVIVVKDNNQPKPDTNVPAIAQSLPTTTRENPFTNTNDYMYILIGVNALIVILIIFGLVWLLRRK